MTLTQINKAGLDELALDHVFTIGASGTDHYTFQGEGLNGTVNDPTLYLTRGKTYRFENGTGAHPIRIQSTSGASGTAYNTGVTNNAGSGTVIVEVQHDAPDVLYYQCTSHANMNGVLYITGALADGGVTTAKLADDAVTDAKLANSINSAIAANTAKNTNATHTGDVTGSSSLTIASNAVTTAKIADGNVTAAKLASGVQTTINNNADNRVITGSGTANTLEGESDVVISSGLLGINQASPTERLHVGGNAIVTGYVQSGDGTSSNCSFNNVGDSNTGLYFPASDTLGISTGGSERMRVDASGKVGINEASPVNFLTISNTAGQTDSVGNLQIRYTGTNNAANSGLTVKNYRGTSQFMQWDGNGVRIGSRILTNSGTGDIYFTTQNDSVRAKLTSNGLILNGSDTAAANALDDYEEGICSSIGITTANTGYVRKTGGTVYYTKIGRAVHLFGQFSSNEFANYFGGNGLQITGFPFTASGYANSADIMVAIWGGSYNWWDAGYPSISMSNNATTHDLYSHRTPGGTGLAQYAAVTGSNMGAGSAQFNFDLTYFTDA